ncbi:hypothetical protein BDW42DRAFT_200665 [Aspergillus taichungensis]|uniref:T6SS Phospholipase effector Tle1-like catalytic domain-containing protein n=1 Tax=Aspergillus taichungensis TaxID=482145 RepID=A0A2J5HXA0_9EURO|nr:hypothetical protein BDW42DRAFT_200665 [Aspergillus taichungensis]
MAGPCDCEDTPPTRELVLCFDGTGNTFRADGEESNILKIFRMLDRTKEKRSGIGTDITPGAFANLAFRPFSNLPTHKIFDQALATSFDQHVIRGYRFLARRWQPGAKIYLFGFSRGAYTARFLNEMLDFVGLISADNEELIPFVWEAFTQWKFADSGPERRAAERCLRISRDTMCRSVGFVQFLGLFDTVNSVAEFNRDESKDQQVQPNPRIMRHAVSIDERRIKFQPVLFEDPRPGKYPGRAAKRVSTWAAHGEEALAAKDRERASTCGQDSPIRTLSPSQRNDDFEEVYFAGDHSDVGGGRQQGPGDVPASQIPLMWMVQEAILAGLTFDPDQLARLGCFDPRTQRADPKIVQAATAAEVHDSLDYDGGKGFETLFWRIMEYFPFKRPKITPDGSVAMTRWHTRGLRRPLPEGARIHGSVIERLRRDREYRPYNLGLGHKVAEKQGEMAHRDIGRWRHVEHAGMCDYWVRVRGADAQDDTVRSRDLCEDC